MRVAAMLLLLVLCAAVSEGLVQAYSVAPITAQWSGKVRGDENHPISQLVTCNFDHLDGASGGYVEFFAGSVGNGGSYNLDVYDAEGGLVASHHGVAAKEHNWVRFGGLVLQPGESFSKGKRYLFKFTRSGQDSGYWGDTGDATHVFASPTGVVCVACRRAGAAGFDRSCVRCGSQTRWSRAAGRCGCSDGAGPAMCSLRSDAATGPSPRCRLMS
jgi:hypothetical protein